jgi:protein-arginine kinase activator protein McsA
MATTKDWYARMREGIPEEAECRFCGNKATLKACWKITTGGIAKGYLCEDCHDEMEQQISNNKHESSTQAA